MCAGNSKKNKPKALIIEDETAQAYALQARLSVEGIESIVASSGRDGLSLVYKEKPDIVVLDVLLPGFDGLDILKEIKEEDDKEIKNIPVLILSQLAQKENIDEGLKLGASEYLVKSETKLDDVIKKVKGILNL
ncbi:response regulator [bacterium (Candidatus Torokbacteria) CG_4_10_14_0_2_um_filter_35_8]|nr:MAG: response regulator [bacterium (Candidatus Torokbacteria) CG_4_10_14_0_2_um_filter_35_8]